MSSKTFKSKNVSVVCDYAQEGDSFHNITVNLKTFDGPTIIVEKRLVDSSFSEEKVNETANELLKHYSQEL